MHVELQQLDDQAITIARISGAMNRFSSPRLKETLIRTVEAGTSELIIDLSDVTTVDSSGLGVLLGMLQRVRKLGGDLRLIGVSQKLTTILETMSLDQILHQHDTVQDAITYFRSPGPTSN